VLGTALGQLLDQLGLARARLAFEQDQAAVALAGPLQLGLDGAQLAVAAHEGGLGERAAGVEGADDHRQGAFPRRHRGGDLVEVGEHGPGRGVPVGRLLHHQALHELVQGRGDGRSQAAQAGHRLGDVLAQHVADAAGAEEGPPGQALPQHRSGRVQIRAFVRLVGHQAGGLGGGVPGRPQPGLRDTADRPAEPSHAEVHQRGLLHPVRRDRNDHVRRAHVAVQEAALVGLRQRLEHAPSDRQGLGQRERPGREVALEGRARDVGRDEVEDRALAAGREGPDEPGAGQAVELGQRLGQPGRGDGGVRPGDRTDDHIPPGVGIDAAQGLAGGSGLEQARGPEPAAEPPGLVVPGLRGAGRGGSPPRWSPISDGDGQGCRRLCRPVDPFP
jgi:hypothetical protein